MVLGFDVDLCLPTASRLSLGQTAGHHLQLHPWAGQSRQDATFPSTPIVSVHLTSGSCTHDFTTDLCSYPRPDGLRSLKPVCQGS